MYLFEEKAMLLMIGQYFFNSFFVTYDFTTLSDLNVNPTDLIEILFIRVFLADYLMCLNISLIALKYQFFFA